MACIQPSQTRSNGTGLLRRDVRNAFRQPCFRARSVAGPQGEIRRGNAGPANPPAGACCRTAARSGSETGPPACPQGRMAAWLPCLSDHLNRLAEIPRRRGLLTHSGRGERLKSRTRALGARVPRLLPESRGRSAVASRPSCLFRHSQNRLRSNGLCVGGLLSAATRLLSRSSLKNGTAPSPAPANPITSFKSTERSRLC